MYVGTWILGRMVRGWRDQLQINVQSHRGPHVEDGSLTKGSKGGCLKASYCSFKGLFSTPEFISRLAGCRCAAAAQS